ncbi:hypothetical protein AZI87_10240 [Bdellovibrio bacteriovorus]|uniref:Uncharacterized protein n=1 Tax=Bdellovibrio bacteriovorus TaxID=959 RepID=A0A162H320_BDEBC|nr:hypothetical protein [Bdellovibrio bacteriovorus]KYG69546.1 hypothetical protein AZI87_10240 [Bdellovibrio bacteriovorus]
MKLSAALITLLTAFSAQAQTPVVHAVCTGKIDDIQVVFEIRDTYAVTLKQGLLTIGEDTISLHCRDSKKSKLADKTSVYQCKESRKGDGKLLVEVERGVTGHLIANIQREQIYPMPPASLGSLLCLE